MFVSALNILAPALFWIWKAVIEFAAPFTSTPPTVPAPTAEPAWSVILPPLVGPVPRPLPAVMVTAPPLPPAPVTDPLAAVNATAPPLDAAVALAAPPWSVSTPPALAPLAAPATTARLRPTPADVRVLTFKVRSADSPKEKSAVAVPVEAPSNKLPEIAAFPTLLLSVTDSSGKLLVFIT